MCWQEEEGLHVGTVTSSSLNTAAWRINNCSKNIPNFYWDVIQNMYVITKTNECPICLWRTHELHTEDMSCLLDIPTKTMNVPSTDRLETSLLLCLHFHVDLMDFL